MLAGGAIRSGKTFATGVSFALWLLHEGIGFDHALCGYSVEAVMRNAGFPLISILQGFGLKPRFTRDVGTRIVIPYGGRDTYIWVIGASDNRSYRRLQGSTLKGLVMDEVTLLGEEFFHVAWGRLSVDGSKMWCTFNPESPNHWFKKTVVDRLIEFDGLIIDFLLHDNPTLSPEIIERYNRSFTGHFKKRMIQGMWAGATGLIFPTYKEGEPDPNWTFEVSMDWGVSTQFVALGWRKKGWEACCSSELWLSGNDTELTPEDILRAVEVWVIENNGGCRGVNIYLDPSTPTWFKRELRTKGFMVKNADNEVIPGIVTTQVRLQRGEITLGDCPLLKEELLGYEWDKTKQDRGVDAPTKENDHGSDALRYYVYSTGKAYRNMQMLSVKKALSSNSNFAQGVH